MLTISKFSLKFVVVVFSVLLLWKCNATQNNINERLNVYSHRYCARSCLMATLNWDLNDKNHTDTENNLRKKKEKETKIPTHKCIYTKC